MSSKPSMAANTAFEQREDLVLHAAQPLGRLDGLDLEEAEALLVAVLERAADRHDALPAPAHADHGVDRGEDAQPLLLQVVLQALEDEGLVRPCASRGSCSRAAALPRPRAPAPRPLRDSAPARGSRAGPRRADARAASRARRSGSAPRRRAATAAAGRPSASRAGISAKTTGANASSRSRSSGAAARPSSSSTSARRASRCRGSPWTMALGAPWVRLSRSYPRPATKSSIERGSAARCW